MRKSSYMRLQVGIDDKTFDQIEVRLSKLMCMISLCVKLWQIPHLSYKMQTAFEFNELLGISVLLRVLKHLVNRNYTLPPSKQAVGCKWVYKLNFRVDGTLERHKAPLVAKEYTQQEAIHGWHLVQLDMNNVFFHNDLTEEVYMYLPQGYHHEGKTPPNTVCFTQAVLVYVDHDIIVANNDSNGNAGLKCFLDSQFKLKDLRQFKYFLGLEVAKSKKGIFVSQRLYALQLLSKAEFLGC
ncbi:Retrovirus-related Pol polyprotein from transposon RE2 [Vitis vinifera]|uniref:Retrovirus-related Pol polyprotein from transposon RE2 n=1 Tax=Vitis vinifera TaxID=29760 RepID=A0A438C7V8_VITVI|nr:Retrovirus-related Pol polyprotein from transposon RE2 [Vitis vinifera]